MRFGECPNGLSANQYGAMNINVSRTLCFFASQFLTRIRTTRFILYKNHVYKNVEAQKCPFFKNIVVILLVVISISFEPQDEI